MSGAEDRRVVRRAATRVGLLVGGASAIAGRKLPELLTDPADWSAWAEAPATGRTLQFSMRTAGGALATLRGDVASSK